MELSLLSSNTDQSKTLLSYSVLISQSQYTLGLFNIYQKYQFLALLSHDFRTLSLGSSKLLCSSTLEESRHCERKEIFRAVRAECSHPSLWRGMWSSGRTQRSSQLSETAKQQEQAFCREHYREPKTQKQPKDEDYFKQTSGKLST